MSVRWRWGTAAIVAASIGLPFLLIGILGGFGSDTPVYVVLENSMRSELRAQFKGDPAVDSVNCTPHAQDVSYDQGYVHFRCLATFSNGTSFSGAATVEARSYQVSGWNFDIELPGSLDLTDRLPVRPADTAPATPSASLFASDNLTPLVAALARRFPGQLVLQAAIYPGTAQFVIGADGSARLISAHSAGSISVGAPVNFDGDRSGIEISQIKPEAIQHASTAVTRAGDLGGAIDRIILDPSLTGDNAGWLIYALRGATHYQLFVDGDGLRRIGSG